MKRVGIADIMRETGLSRATVDRVLNGRGRVHARTRETVERALQRLMTPAGATLAAPQADVVLRLGRGMTAQMKAAWDRHQPSGDFHDLYQATDGEVLDVVSDLASDRTRALIISAKNTDGLVDVLQAARQKGKRVVAIVSDLAPAARDVFLGIDNRAAGQAAAFLIGRTLGDRPTSVGVVLGDLAFRCHEDREIGFRTGLRAHFPRIVLSGEAQGEDSAELTKVAVLRLLREQPALGAIYNLGGGNVGLVDAVREAGMAGHMLVIAHEVNSVTVPLLRDGRIDYAIASDPALLIDEALRHVTAEQVSAGRDEVLHDFAVYTRFNIPAFAY